MSIARLGRLLVFALVVHFALLLPIADIAHGTAHPDEAGCDICDHLGTLQHGLVTPVAAGAIPRAGESVGVPPPYAAPRTVLTAATARGPPTTFHTC